jgi:hypothetical protein
MGATDCLTTGATSGQGERTRFFSRQLITADDLTQDQRYHRDKRRLHNRLLHGWGIVCGLEVGKNPLSGVPLNVTICPGYALSPQGDEIFVPMEIQFDLERCVVGQDAPCHSPCGPAASRAVDPTKELYLAIKYAECPSHPVRVSPIGCGCDDTACEYSRIRDSYEVTCLEKLPESHDENNRVSDALCSIVTDTKVIACPQCPKDPWIVLAQVHFDGMEIDTISSGPRHVLLSTAVMQEHLRANCA